MFVRRRWARRRGHPDYLWPDVPIDAWRRGLRGIEGAIADVFAGRTGRLPGDLRSRALGIAAMTSGTGPLLGRWLGDGRIEAQEDTAALLREHLDHGRRRWARMTARYAEVAGALDAAGVAATALKGIHTALYFPEPGTRPAADIDLAVDPSALATAEAVLADLGYTPGRQRVRPYRREWRRPGEQPASLDLTHADNPLAIELHGGLDRDFFGVRRIAFDDEVATWSIGETAPAVDRGDRPDAPGRRARSPAGGDLSRGEAAGQALAPEWLLPGSRALAQPHLWVYLAVHASEELHRLQLLRLVELVLVARRDLTGPDAWGEVRALADRLDARRFLYPAAALAAKLAPDAIDAETVAELAADASPAMRRFVDGLRPADAQRFERLSLADRYLWVKGPGETLRRTAYLLWPARSRAVGAVYIERMWRVLRGRVSLRSDR